MRKATFLLTLTMSLTAAAQVQVDSLNRLVVGSSYHPGGLAVHPLNPDLKAATGVIRSEVVCARSVEVLRLS